MQFGHKRVATVRIDDEITDAEMSVETDLLAKG